MKTTLAVAIYVVCGATTALGQVYSYYPRFGRGIYRYQQEEPELYRYRVEQPELYRYRRNGDSQNEPENGPETIQIQPYRYRRDGAPQNVEQAEERSETVQIQPVRLRGFGAYQPSDAGQLTSGSSPQPAFRQTGLPISEDRADFIEAKGYKHKGHVGPVYTFVKTDYDANFKWGVRHVAGKEYGKK